MAFISRAEREKKIIRLTLWLLHKKLGLSTEEMAKDLENCGNQIFREMYAILKETCNNIQRPFQKRTAYEVGVVFMWLAYKDTAYKNPTEWAFTQTLLRAPQLLQVTEEITKPPEEWTANVWHQSKKDTDKLRAEGKISNNEHSPAEEIYIPSLQRRRLKKLR